MVLTAYKTIIHKGHIGKHNILYIFPRLDFSELPGILRLMKRLFLLRFKQFFSLIIGIIRIPFTTEKYGVKRGYRARKSYTHFNDVGWTDQAQREVYEMARSWAEKNDIKQILDLGCGSGYKLVNYFDDEFETVGIEIQETLECLRKTYPERTWLDGLNTDFSELNAKLVICSDVIEHVVDPDEFLDNILKIKDLEYLIVSTPDRLIIRGWYDYGPPRNRQIGRASCRERV